MKVQSGMLPPFPVFGDELSSAQPLFWGVLPEVSVLWMEAAQWQNTAMLAEVGEGEGSVYRVDPGVSGDE